MPQVKPATTPRSKKDTAERLKRRHVEWLEFRLRWEFLLDSLEGGDRYRQASYGADRRGFPLRNLVRHKHEMPDPRDGFVTAFGNANASAGTAVGADPTQYAEDDDYELRRARTPVPAWLKEAVDTYTGKLFASEIDRGVPEGPAYAPLVGWWADVDGLGTTMDQWMSETVAPLLLALGHLDILLDHPPAPEGVTVGSALDAAKHRITRCVAGFILPQNMVDWTLDPTGRRYETCTYIEYADGMEEVVGESFGPASGRAALDPFVPRVPFHYRVWTATESTLYSRDGEVVSATPHNFGCVPILRVFDRRRHRCKNVGQPRLETEADLAREFYNRSSELILSDVLQAHALLQGPEEYVQADGTVPVGPGNLLPMKQNNQPNMSSYVGFSYIDPPKGGADSIRQNMAMLREEFERLAKIVKPAGAAGRSVVGQSGVSKAMDLDALNARLTELSRVFGRVEKELAMLALTVLADGRPPATAGDDVTVTYPTVFSLHAADELAAIGADIQSLLQASGGAPEFEAALIAEAQRKALPGRDDKTYDTWADEVTAAVQAHAKAAEQQAEGLAAAAEAGATAAEFGPESPDGTATHENTLISQSEKAGLQFTRTDN